MVLSNCGGYFTKLIYVSTAIWLLNAQVNKSNNAVYLSLFMHVLISEHEATRLSMPQSQELFASVLYSLWNSTALTRALP